nr:hypothetical protein [Tanacetum cinerariifolium]
MAKKSVLPNNLGKGTGHKESRPGHPQQALKTKGIVDSGTPQQNKVAKRKNKTLIEATRTMLADSSLPITFWIETVNTACYVLNRALVTKLHNKTPYELLNGRSPRLDFMRPFGCPVTILITLDPLGKFEGKADEGFLVGYPVTSKAFRLFNTKTRKVEENLHVMFLENKPNLARKGPNWIFDIDSLTNSMNYIPVSAENQTNKNAGPQDTNGNACTKDNVDAEKEVSDQHYIVLPLWSSISSTYKSSDDKAEDDKPKDDIGSKTVVKPVNKEDQAYRDELDKLMRQEKEASITVDSLGTFSAGGPSSPHPDAFIPDDTLLHVDQDHSQIPDLEDTAKLRSTGIFTSAYDDDLDIFTSLVQSVGAEADFNNIESSTVVSHIPTHRVHIDHLKDQILGDPQLAIQTRRMEKKSYGAHAFVSYIHKQRRTNHKDYENCLFSCFLSQMEPKRLVNMRYEKKAIGTKWVYKNKKDVRGIVVRNKARMVAQGHIQEEGIEYDEMDVKSVFLYGIIEEVVYVSQPPGFIDPQFPNKGDYRQDFVYQDEKNDIMLVQVYVDGIISGSTKKSLCDEFEASMHKRFQMSSMGELTFFLGLQVKQSKEGIFISQDKSMIGSLMYLTASRPDIMFAVCTCSKFQVTPKLSHIYVMKRILRKSTIEGCQFLGKGLISWQCKKQTIVATSITKAEYVVAANCHGQVLWIQNQMLDYGFNFMNTKIYIDNESTIVLLKMLFVMISKGKNGDKLVSAAGFGLYCLA